jgi:hypothetical protein
VSAQKAEFISILSVNFLLYLLFFLRLLLEIKLTIFTNINKSEDVFQLLILMDIFAGLRLKLLLHAMELFKGEVAATWVVPFSEGVLGGISYSSAGDR